MTSLTAENLNAFCDALRTNANYKTAAATIGVAESTIYSWRTRCITDQKKNDQSSPFYIQRGDAWGWWTSFVESSRREFFLSFTGQMMQEAKEGITTVVRDASQQVIYRRDPRFIGRSDAYVCATLGLEPWELEPVHRLLLGEDGLPIPETRVDHIPSNLRLRVLEAASDEFKPSSHQSLDVNVSGNVVHEQKPLLPPKDQKRVDIEELRKIAALSPEERRARFGGKAYATDAAGRRTIPALSPPLNDRPDDQNLGKRPGVEPYVPPAKPAPVDQGQPRPSYAKPQRALDHSGYGEGKPPSGGFRVA